MKHRRLALVLLALGTALLAHSSVQAADPADAGWTTLFNGKDLSGWTVVNGGEFAVTNGVIHLTRGAGWLRSAQQYTNFIFEAEWRALEKNYNSGLLIRAAAEGKPFPTNVWQVNLKGTALGTLMRGSKTLVTNAAPARPMGEWGKFRITVTGSHIRVEADGRHLWDYDQLDATSGFLGLQAENKSFEFRHIRVRPLGANPVR
jgi:hypothetical protein